MAPLEPFGALSRLHGDERSEDDGEVLIADIGQELAHMLALHVLQEVLRLLPLPVPQTCILLHHNLATIAECLHAGGVPATSIPLQDMQATLQMYWPMHTFQTALDSHLKSGCCKNH